jgi:hypothetical protein
MLKAIQIKSTARLDEDAPALANPAIARCVQVWKSAFDESAAQGKSKFDAGQDATLAYCAALPPLAGDQNISDFIACVGYAMAIEIISPIKAPELLLVARIARAAISKEPRKTARAAA